MMNLDTWTEGLLLDVNVFRFHYVTENYFWIYAFGSIVRFFIWFHHLGGVLYALHLIQVESKLICSHRHRCWFAVNDFQIKERSSSTKLLRYLCHVCIDGSICH